MPRMLDTLKDALAHNPVEHAALVEMERDPMGMYEAIKQMALDAGIHDEYVRQQRVTTGGRGFTHTSERWASHRVASPHYPALRALLAAWHAEGIRRGEQMKGT